MNKTTTARTAPPTTAKPPAPRPTLASAALGQGAATTPQGQGAAQPTSPAIATWRTLNRVLRQLTEAQAHALLQEERAGQARIQIMLRLHGRMNKLRVQRERREYLLG